ncbi:MAG: F-type H+-transporting ATPase subunit b [Actinomycetota bacterium]|jgi:F-type H+-transporting ATPase subunit b|nr:F-type H+-transporting ATPase subunit b [Actinomycetota bacterium]
MRVRAVVAALLIAAGSLFAGGSAAWAEPTHVGEECIKILDNGGDPVDCHQAPSPIIPAKNEIIWGAISFTVLLVLMWKFAFPGLKKGMEARTTRIRESLDESERTKSEAQRILEDYQRQLADAKNESNRIIEEARQTAEQMRRDLMARAEAEVNELRDRTRQEIDAAQQRALADLRREVSELAIGAAEVVVQRNLDRDTNRAIVERFIEQVGTNA